MNGFCWFPGQKHIKNDQIYGVNHCFQKKNFYCFLKIVTSYASKSGRNWEKRMSESDSAAKKHRYRSFTSIVYFKKNVLQCSVIFYLLVIIKKYILRSIVYFVLFCMKLGHHKSRKVTELDFWKKILGCHKFGHKTFRGYLWNFLPISLHLVIKLYWNFIYVISLRLSNSSQKPYV